MALPSRSFLKANLSLKSLMHLYKSHELNYVILLELLCNLPFDAYYNADVARDEIESDSTPLQYISPVIEKK